MIFAIFQETDTIVGSPKLRANWKRFSTGKHYVRSVTYGGFLIASLKFQAKNEKDKESVEAKVSANVEAGGGKVDIEGQFKKLAEAASDISTLSVSYFATSTFTTVSTDITSLIDTIKDFPNQVS